MLVACVKVGDKYGPEYVTRLRDGVERHLAWPHEFVCFTDAAVAGVKCEPPPAKLPGWWAKLGLFRFHVPMIYFDLDVVITGDLAGLVTWPGFGIIKDWWLPGFNSSVMRLTGAERSIWERFTPGVMSTHSFGDQQWITEQIPSAATFPPHWFPSYKADHCQDRVPADAKAVIFHGHPKPHECGGWVGGLWRGHNKAQQEETAHGQQA